MINMIPRRETLSTPIGEQVITQADTVQIITHPTHTYRLNNNRITGDVDGIDAMKQAIYKIIAAERYEYLVYDWNYGIELKDLFGKPKPFVRAELPRRIREALMADDRITNVRDFVFMDTTEKNTIRISFTAETIFGDISSIFNYLETDLTAEIT